MKSERRKEKKQERNTTVSSSLPFKSRGCDVLGCRKRGPSTPLQNYLSANTTHLTSELTLPSQSLWLIVSGFWGALVEFEPLRWRDMARMLGADGSVDQTPALTSKSSMMLGQFMDGHLFIFFLSLFFLLSLLLLGSIELLVFQIVTLI